MRAISGHQTPEEIAAVVRAGMLEPGEQVSLTYKGVTHVATVRSDGTLDAPGHPTPAALSFAAELVIGGGRWNGWDHWWVLRGGERTLLTKLRHALATEGPLPA